MIKLDLLQTFAQVVRSGSFSAAARHMGVPRSTVSLHIQTVETALQVRLFKRSTRKLVLTEDGRQLHAMAQGPLESLAHALRVLQGGQGTLRGPIRLTLPADFPAEPIAQAITSFQRHHPGVRFQILPTSERLDLVGENIDIALRMSDASSPDAVERSVLEIDWLICANVDWLARNGTPESFDTACDVIAPGPALRMFLERHVLSGKFPEPSIEVDSLLMARSLVAQGFGCALLPSGTVQAMIDAGQVQRMLPAMALRTTRLKLAFPTRGDMIPRVRAFADHLTHVLRHGPEIPLHGSDV